MLSYINANVCACTHLVVDFVDHWYVYRGNYWNE